MPVQNDGLGRRAVHEKHLVKKTGGVSIEVIENTSTGSGSTGITIDDVQQRLTTCRVVAVTDIAVDETTTTVDGVTLSDNDIVLKAVAAGSTESGAWIASTTTAWTRVDDIDANTHFSVSEGDDYANTLWRVITPSPIVVGTTAIVIRKCGRVLPYDLARYTSTYQTTNVAAATYADVELNAETAVTESADVTTSPFVYTAPSAQTADVSASMRYADNEHIVRTVLAINVNDADAEAVFVPIVRGGYGYMSVSTRLSLLTSDTVKVIARAYNADASSQELLIDQQEIIITTT